jgi:hypothetical protein
MTSKSLLTREAIDAQTALELPDRQLMAVAVANGGLVAIAAAVDVHNIPITVTNNTICVNAVVIADQSQAHC